MHPQGSRDNHGTTRNSCTILRPFCHGLFDDAALARSWLRRRPAPVTRW
jgi:hypothetical protein